MPAYHGCNGRAKDGLDKEHQNMISKRKWSQGSNLWCKDESSSHCPTRILEENEVPYFAWNWNPKDSQRNLQTRNRWLALSWGRNRWGVVNWKERLLESFVQSFCHFPRLTQRHSDTGRKDFWIIATATTTARFCERSGVVSVWIIKNITAKNTSFFLRNRNSLSFHSHLQSCVHQ